MVLGHYVKMVHNGIYHGDMQLIAGFHPLPPPKPKSLPDFTVSTRHLKRQVRPRITDHQHANTFETPRCRSDGATKVIRQTTVCWSPGLNRRRRHEPFPRRQSSAENAAAPKAPA